MDKLKIIQAILVGNSAGGSVAMLTSLTHPERVKALVLVDAAIYNGGGTPSWAAWLVQSPQMQHIGPLIARRISDSGVDFARSAWHNPSLITNEIWEGYTKPLQAENWDQALWNLTSASRDLDLDEQLNELSMPVLVITGDDDQIVPTENSIRLAEEIPGAELVVIPNCGHVPHEECPDAFLAATLDFVSRLP
jgi:pimeloyl-ACP methyl ester carboxylesterase